ncbi:hypothetical protein HHK36_021531 [Tetracentron sinense]|uniref:ABC transporter domain-containing protein n=1 Tax=Tetracentron sinense TaxID=13715 RepID=A0A834YSB6_TETSI|nr:hypothetical protein HHK36_021531 [Tetracentron sinense]
MESGDVYTVGSLRMNSRVKEISRSSREEDDEEALKWATIEKLPTYLRIKRGILTGEEGQTREIDIRSLGLQEKKILLERLVRVADENNEKFLLKLKNRIDRVGIEILTIEVRFENLNVNAEAYVGNRALPTILNFSVNLLEGFLNYLHILPSRKKPFSILHDVSGIIKPCRPPGSGKTTLLLALAGKLDSNLKFSGRLSYNCHGMDEFIPQRTSAYISQNDLHIGEMTVRETLAFSARCQGVGSRYEMLAELSRREKEANIKPDPDLDIFMKAAALEGQEANVVTDYILKILGLEVCADTMVGDEMLRGISGGQRKRVTTGEMLVGPAKVLFMDEISTAPETYDLFDDIILLSDGQIVYQGPREHMLQFFESMGFKCPERKGVADFLQEVTSKKDQKQYWARNDEPYSFVPVKEFAEAFQSFHVGRKVGDELAIPFDKTKSHPAALTTKKYGVNRIELLKACISRELLLMKRNSFVYIFKMTQLIITGIITMTLFLRTEMHRDSSTDGQIFMGALFFSVMMASGLFRFIGALGRNMIVAGTFGSFALLAVMVLGGFILSRDDVQKWWLWGYWISPMMYGQNAITVNEFLGESWRHVPPNSTEPLGVTVLKSRGIFHEAHWYWIGVAFGKPQALLSEETLSEKHANRTGELIDLSSRERTSSRESGDESRRRSTSSGSSSTRIDRIDEANQNRKRGMVLPFEPLSITVDEIGYAVDMPQEMKAQGVPEDWLELLKVVNGAFRPGVLTALMGVSGAGKTTLLDVLAGRKTSGYIEGSITISGYPKKQETFARISGYCEQTDIHSPHVTFSESLLYSAWLRLPPDVNSATRKMFIEEVMELVELTSLREALVGLPGVNGLSTEQRKRLTIAVELVANPSIIFMDEPTSGLDARAAAIVMRTVRNTVDTGRTVVCTIHQPSIDLFEAFDELFLLKQGEEIYVGPLGCHSSHLVEYFESSRESTESVRYKMVIIPATWMLEVTTAAQEAALGVNFAEVYKNSELYRRNKALIKELSIPPPASKDVYFPTQYSVFLHPVYGLPMETALVILAEPSIYCSETLLHDLCSSDVWDNILGSWIQKPVVAVERTVFYRERAAGMYSAFPYAFGQVMIELPYILLQSVIYGVIVYAMIGFDWTIAKFFWYLFFMYFTLLYFTFYGMMTVAITPNHNIAAIISSTFYAIWNLFSGFIVPRTRIPVWWRWYYWFCPVSWSLYGLVAAQFGDIQDRLDPGETVEDFVYCPLVFQGTKVGADVKDSQLLRERAV